MSMNERTSTHWTEYDTHHGDTWCHYWLHVYEPDAPLDDAELTRLADHVCETVERYEAYPEGSGVPGTQYHHAPRVLTVSQTLNRFGRAPVVTVLISQYGGLDV